MYCHHFFCFCVFGVALEGLKCDFLCLVEGGPLDGLELVHEFSLEGLVVGVGPRPVFLERLGDADLKVEATPADLAGDAGAR
jgi:hypothetical protein